MDGPGPIARRIRNRRRHREYMRHLRSLPADAVAGPPDFVGVGAQRAGTSWWYELIAAHPQVFRSDPRKELHYFDRFWEREFSDADVTRYHRFFTRPPGRLAGEWTPRYMSEFWISPLLKRAAPDAKILVLLRDPVERFVSGVRLMRAQERHPAILAEDAFRRGLYFQQLSDLLVHFARDQVLVLQFESCRDDTITNLRRTYEFLEIADTNFVPSDVEKSVVVRGERQVVLPGRMRTLLIERYRDDVERLAAAFPEIDLSLWPSFSGPAKG